MSIYSPSHIEKKWQQFWAEKKVFCADNHSEKPKYYVLDMFPYPSGDGLHVGHPLGYIASDIVARYKKSCGFNVLHPMGFDAFGLPAEQYAIQTGQHPAVTTQKNIAKYIEQLTNIGLAYDWSRQVCTSDPSYYKWTQWIFSKLFESWYDIDQDKARSVEELVEILNNSGNKNIIAYTNENTPEVTSLEWLKMSDIEKQKFLLNYRLAFLAESVVNWCPALGTVLANEEVKDGVSERGGYPVEKRSMLQWMLRITAYADRLLDDLESLDWSDAVKSMQKHWIGRSHGANISFEVFGHKKIEINIFTTRPETIFGVSYLALAWDHPILEKIVPVEKRAQVDLFIHKRKNKNSSLFNDRSDFEGIFAGAYVKHPFTGKKIPIWIADYVLSDYGTGAVMAVPAHDSKDFRFAKKYDLPVNQVIYGGDISIEAHEELAGEVVNSMFLDKLDIANAKEKILEKIETLSIGKKVTTFRLRDAVFSRQRYWGEPFPVYYKDNLPQILSLEDLPLVLPDVESYKPTSDGRPPLANAKKWITNEGFPLETNTMPGWAGSSWYFLRYMDPNNDKYFVDKNFQDYWQNVDLYIGGAEHATGHLIYARFWTKFLFDLGFINVSEPFKKLVNQGMIQGISNFVYRIKDTNTYVSRDFKDGYETTQLRVSVDLVKNDKLDLDKFKQWRPDFNSAQFVLNKNGDYLCGAEVEKMSKSKHNIVSPDNIIEKYGADTLRLYTMFLGPIEQSKPWDTNGIDGVYRFLIKLWRLFHNESGEFLLDESKPTLECLQVLHKTIKKINHSINSYALNTAVSAFMICVNELTKAHCNNRLILSDLLILLAPFVPHIAEELWERLGNNESIAYAPQPIYDEKHLMGSTFEYPISINGKVRTKISFDIDARNEDMQREILADEIICKWLEGKVPQKIIIVPNRIVNIVI